MGIVFKDEDIFNAVKASVGTPTGGLISKWEGHPIPYPDNARLPMVFVYLAEATQEEEGHHLKQEYRFEVYYVMDSSNMAEPHKTARQRASEIVDNLAADLTLGTASLGLYSIPTGMSLECEPTAMFRQERQPRLAVRIDLVVRREGDRT
jgi:hypothetical protein